MAGYADTKQLIENTLVGRPAGSLIYPEGHQQMAMSLLDYIHSVELLGAGTLQEIATTSTVPVQPDDAKVSYIATVPPGQTYTFTNFHDQNGNSISVTTGSNTMSLLIFIWNGEYWQVQNNQIQLAIDYSDGYLFKGVALHNMSFGTFDHNVFYIGGEGVYPNFGSDGLTVPDGKFVVFYYNGSWGYEFVSILNPINILEDAGNDTVVRAYVSELCILTPTGNKVEGAYVTYFYYNSSQGGLSIAINDGNGVEICSLYHQNPAANTVVEMRMGASYSDYYAYLVYNGNTEDGGWGTGLGLLVSEDIFSLKNWSNIASYLGNITSSINKRLHPLVSTVNEVNAFVDELYIATPDGKPISGISVFSYGYDATDGFTLILYKNGVEIAACFRQHLSAGQVYKMITTGVGYEDCKFYLVYSGYTSSGGSGVSFALTDDVFNLSCWKTIENYISDNVIKLTDNYEKKFVSQNYTNQSAADQRIKELFITGVDAKRVYSLYTLQINNGGSTNLIFVDSSYNIIFYAEISQQSRAVEANKVYKFTNNPGTSQYDIQVYVVFSDVSSYISGYTYTQVSDKCFNIQSSGLINSYILGSSKPTKPDFVYVPEANACIEELYIPTIDNYPGAYVYRLIVQQNGSLRLFVKDQNGDNFIQWGLDTDKYYFKYGAITPLYLHDTVNNIDTPQIIGWIKLRWNDKDYASDMNHGLNVAAVKDINNSPKIKAMLNNSSQILLWGDSKFGFNDIRNDFQDILMGLTGMRVYQCGFGGCRMGWTSADGSNRYDKFTAVSLSDAWVNRDFTEQDAAYQEVMQLDGINYFVQMQAAKEIDLSKRTLVVLNYEGNDFHTSLPIGDVFNKELSLSAYDKTSMLGAMNYAVQNMLTRYPSLYFMFCTPWYYIFDDGQGGYGVCYDEVNSLNKTFEEYNDALKENVKRLGLRLIDFLNLGYQNYFANKVNVGLLGPTDHMNEYGYAMAAKWLLNEIKMVFDID